MRNVEHIQNKHRHLAFARRPNRAQRGHRKVTIAAQYGLLHCNRSSVGAHKGCYANAVVVCCVGTETAQRSWRCHCVLNTVKARGMRCERCGSAVKAP